MIINFQLTVQDVGSSRASPQRVISITCSFAGGAAPGGSTIKGPTNGPSGPSPPKISPGTGKKLEIGDSGAGA